MKLVLDWVQLHGGFLGVLVFCNAILTSIKVIVDKVQEFLGEKPGKISQLLSTALIWAGKLLDIGSANKEH
jgi:hypothetical protein